MSKESLRYSISFHFLIVLFITVLVKIKTHTEVKQFEFSIVEQEAVVVKKMPKIIVNATKIKNIKKVTAKSKREIFGVSRNAITNTKGKVEVKLGNNLNKKEDKKTLLKDDPDSLPQATEEFLITSMPRPINEIRPPYPRWAKERKISGSVIFEILIDGKGDVRSAKLLKGIDPRLDDFAKIAILKFKFKPAYIEKKATAVRIKYAIKYVLED